MRKAREIRDHDRVGSRHRRQLAAGFRRDTRERAHGADEHRVGNRTVRADCVELDEELLRRRATRRRDPPTDFAALTLDINGDP